MSGLRQPVDIRLDARGRTLLLDDLVVDDHKDRRWRKKYDHIAAYLQEKGLPFDISTFQRASLLWIVEATEAGKRKSIPTAELRDALRRDTIALFKEWIVARTERRLRRYILEKPLEGP